MKAKNRQSLFDIAIQQFGSIEAVVMLSVDNNISITDDLQAGQELLIRNNAVLNPTVLEFYKANGIEPATSISDEDAFAELRIFDDTFNETFN